MSYCPLPHCVRRELERQRRGASVEWIEVDVDCRCTVNDDDLSFLRRMTPKRQQTIVGICIHYADITDKTGEAVAKIIEHSSSIKECVITGGRLTVSTYKALTVALQKNTSLSVLRVNFNGAYEESLDREFVYALSVNFNRPTDSCWSFVDGKDDAYRRIKRMYDEQFTVKTESRELPRLIDAYSSYWQPSGSRRRR